MNESIYCDQNKLTGDELEQKTNQDLEDLNDGLGCPRCRGTCLIVGKHIMYCADCGQIIAEYKNKKIIKRLMNPLE